MPKANKHAEVKPSKFKTTLCNYFVKNEPCPFGAKCAFAHGESELQTEERNMQVLKETGLRRLDGGDVPLAPTTPTSVISGNLSDSVNTPNSPVSPAAPASPASLADLSFSTSCLNTRRRPVMISLPKYTTRSDHFQSPYEAVHNVYSYTQQATIPPQRPLSPAAPVSYGRCRCEISSTCRQEQPLTYRHNPYNIFTY